MSKVTDRLENQNIINLARQQYENQQRAKVPGYSANLPSLGLVYPADSPLRSGVVEMRHMTAYDEDILTNASYIKDGTVLEKLIDSLIITPGVSCNDLIVGDRESLIITARIFAYGKTYSVQVTDPDSGSEVMRDIDLSKIPFKPFNLQSDDSGEFEYKVNSTGDTIKFKYLTSGETGKINQDHAISDFMKFSITEINGNREYSAIEDYVRFNFMAKDSKDFRSYILQNRPGLDFNLEFEGESGSTFTAGFLIGGDLFWV